MMAVCDRIQALSDKRTSGAFCLHTLTLDLIPLTKYLCHKIHNMLSGLQVPLRKLVLAESTKAGQMSKFITDLPSRYLYALEITAGHTAQASSELARRLLNRIADGLGPDSLKITSSHDVGISMFLDRLIDIRKCRNDFVFATLTIQCDGENFNKLDMLTPRTRILVLRTAKIVLDRLADHWVRHPGHAPLEVLKIKGCLVLNSREGHLPLGPNGPLRLDRLIVSQMKAPDSAVKGLIVPILRANVPIVRLKITRNAFQAVHIAEIFAALSTNNMVHHVILTHNLFVLTKGELERMMGLIRGNRTLISLDLTGSVNCGPDDDSGPDEPAGDSKGQKDPDCVSRELVTLMATNKDVGTTPWDIFIKWTHDL